MNIKPLVQSEFKMRIIKDLGVIYPTSQSKFKIRYAVFECTICKDHIKRGVPSVRQRSQKYCGKCSRIMSPNKRTHAQSQIREYKIWKALKSRCRGNPRYTTKKIKVCDRWVNSFENFIKDMGYRPSIKHSIDRIDNDGNYEPSNCRWATNDIQTSNQGMKINNTSGYTGIYKNNKRWGSSIQIKKEKVYLGSFDTAKEAAVSRNDYIVANCLPHRLNII